MTPVSYKRSEQALFAEVGDDVVALHVANGHCYGMADVAAEVWSLLAEPITLAALCGRLVERYEIDADTCQQEVGGLLQQLRNEGLVEVA